MHHGYANMQQW